MSAHEVWLRCADCGHIQAKHAELVPCYEPGCICKGFAWSHGEVEIPDKEEADAILRAEGLDPEEVGKRFASQVTALLEMMK